MCFCRAWWWGAVRARRFVAGKTWATAVNHGFSGSISRLCKRHGPSRLCPPFRHPGYLCTFQRRNKTHHTLLETTRPVSIPALATSDSGRLSRIAGDQQIARCTVDNPPPSPPSFAPPAAAGAGAGLVPGFQGASPVNSCSSGGGGATLQVRRVGRPPAPQRVQNRGSASAMKGGGGRDGGVDVGESVGVRSSLAAVTGEEG